MQFAEISSDLAYPYIGSDIIVESESRDEYDYYQQQLLTPYDWTPPPPPILLDSYLEQQQQQFVATTDIFDGELNSSAADHQQQQLFQQPSFFQHNNSDNDEDEVIEDDEDDLADLKRRTQIDDEADFLKEENDSLTAKQRRQIRNKISARNFRLRRKEYITTLESEVRKYRSENKFVKQQLEMVMAENVFISKEMEVLGEKMEELCAKDPNDSRNIPRFASKAIVLDAPTTSKFKKNAVERKKNLDRLLKQFTSHERTTRTNSLIENSPLPEIMPLPAKRNIPLRIATGSPVKSQQKEYRIMQTLIDILVPQRVEVHRAMIPNSFPAHIFQQPLASKSLADLIAGDDSAFGLKGLSPTSIIKRTSCMKFTYVIKPTSFISHNSVQDNIIKRSVMCSMEAQVLVKIMWIVLTLFPHAQFAVSTVSRTI